MESNTIYEGDNLDILNKFDDSSIDLIYADPPFFSNKKYEVIWDDGSEVRAFEDRWKGGIEHYISWMKPRMHECHRVLKSTGSIYLHCDWHASHYLKVAMDEIFGYKNCCDEIIWSYSKVGGTTKKLLKWHETIFRYTKTKIFTFNIDEIREPYSQSLIKSLKKDKTGYYYTRGLGTDTKIKRLKKTYVHPKGRCPSDVWDLGTYSAPKGERLGYPTQKPEALLERIIKASSNVGDLVMDPFCGCGTTLSVAQKLGRKWVGIDVSPTACKLVRKRLKKICPGVRAVMEDVSIEYLRGLNDFEFQNWAVADRFMGKVNPKGGDKGIDGFTPQINGGYPIQVKQSDGVGRNIVDNFETAMRRVNKSKGYIVAFSFSKGSYEEVARARNQDKLDITLRTVDDLLNNVVD